MWWPRAVFFVVVEKKAGFIFYFYFSGRGSPTPTPTPTPTPLHDCIYTYTLANETSAPPPPCCMLQKKRKNEAVNGEGGLPMWSSEEVLRRDNLHRGSIYCLAFSPDSALLATGEQLGSRLSYHITSRHVASNRIT